MTRQPAHNPRAPSVPTAPDLTPETVAALIQNHTKELTVRQEEVALQRQKNANTFEFSKQALNAQLEDRNKQREHARTILRYLFISIGGISLLLAGLAGICLWLGKDAIASEIIKTVIYIVSGGIGGWGLRGSIPKKEDKP